MKTKNQAHRSSVVSVAEKAPAPAKPARGGLPSGTPRVEFSAGDRKWMVEFQAGNKSIEIEVVDPKHSIYLYACKDTLVKVCRCVWWGVEGV